MLGEAVVLRQDGRAQLQDGLGTLGPVPILVLPLHPGVELAHQRLHQAARHRQTLLAIPRVVHPPLVVPQVRQRLLQHLPWVRLRQLFPRRWAPQPLLPAGHLLDHFLHLPLPALLQPAQVLFLPPCLVQPQRAPHHPPHQVEIRHHMHEVVYPLEVRKVGALDRPVILLPVSQERPPRRLIQAARLRVARHGAAPAPPPPPSARTPCCPASLPRTSAPTAWAHHATALPAPLRRPGP